MDRSKIAVVKKGDGLRHRGGGLDKEVIGRTFFARGQAIFVELVRVSARVQAASGSGGELAELAIAGKGLEIRVPGGILDPPESLFLRRP